MLSQSAIASSAAESRYRIAAPNSHPRSTLVVALDSASLDRMREVSHGQWTGARFRGVQSVAGDTIELIDPEGAPSELADELSDADVVVMVATSGSDAAVAEPVGSAAFARRIMTAGFVEDVSKDEASLQHTLRGMRPFVISLFVGFDDDALTDLLTAIRA